MTRSPTSPLRLETARGTVRRRLPSVKIGRVVDPETPPEAAAHLRDALDKRWRTFRKRVRKGLPHRKHRIDEAVHDIRTASRRLLSVLAVTERMAARKPARRMAKRVSSILEMLGALRDLTVQRELSGRVESPATRRALGHHGRKLERDFQRTARKVRRKLARQETSGLRRDRRRIRRRLDREAGGMKDVAKAVRSSFAELKTRRRAVDPTRLGSLHRMRLSLKGFRYLMETLEPLVPGVSKEALEALHALQTNMGDLHDIEVLASSLVKLGKDEPSRTAEIAPVLAELEQKHSRMLQSFLGSADTILDHWQHTVAAASSALDRL